MSFCLIYDFGQIAAISMFAIATSLECDYVEGTQNDRKIVFKHIITSNITSL
jgi:hypothetical protein